MLDVGARRFFWLIDGFRGGGDDGHDGRGKLNDTVPRLSLVAEVARHSPTPQSTAPSKDGPWDEKGNSHDLAGWVHRFIPGSSKGCAFLSFSP